MRSFYDSLKAIINLNTRVLNMKKVLGVAGVGLVGAAAFMFSGVYNVSATDKHWDITTRLLELVRDKSVHAASKNIVAPNLDDIKMISNGAKNYDAMCVQCHLAPGAPVSELNQALYPKPPVFHQKDDKHKHKPAETFWVIKNGFKMTGMPAWGEFHTDQQLWEMTAFLQKLKGMSADRYFELVGEGGHSHSDGVHFEASENNTAIDKDDAHSNDGLKNSTHSDTDNHGH